MALVPGKARDITMATIALRNMLQSKSKDSYMPEESLDLSCHSLLSFLPGLPCVLATGFPVGVSVSSLSLVCLALAYLFGINSRKND